MNRRRKRPRFVPRHYPPELKGRFPLSHVTIAQDGISHHRFVGDGSMMRCEKCGVSWFDYAHALLSNRSTIVCADSDDYGDVKPDNQEHDERQAG